MWSPCRGRGRERPLGFAGPTGSLRTQPRGSTASASVWPTLLLQQRVEALQAHEAPSFLRTRPLPSSASTAFPASPSTDSTISECRLYRVLFHSHSSACHRETYPSVHYTITTQAPVGAKGGNSQPWRGASAGTLAALRGPEGLFCSSGFCLALRTCKLRASKPVTQPPALTQASEPPRKLQWVRSRDARMSWTAHGRKPASEGGPGDICPLSA